MKTKDVVNRRSFLKAAGVAAGTAMVYGCTALGRVGAADGEEEEVTPAEDLMREHGVLKRILLVYREGLRRLAARENLPPESIANAAGIVRQFIENYHEKLEEDHLFPRFRKANRLTELIDTLQTQHQAGRGLTDITLQLATAAAMSDTAQRDRLAQALNQFIRMYEPHEAREDTILFPAIRDVVSPRQYEDLGERFEDQEHELFGASGFETVVARAAEIERSLGIYDLRQFTPPM
ncbi:MAG: hemerythrin domain-containing protein [Kiritimatiellae bacterium]|nr:hemerythrin domain-containing protein [Kiritimatiellia bacterium]